MTLRSYLFVMSTLTVITWGIFFFLASTIDPNTTNWLGFLLFYCSLFLALSGISALLGFLFRFVILRQGLAFHLVKISFRQSFLFSLFLILALFLQSYNLLTILNLIFLVLGFSILELFLISRKKGK